MKLQPKNYNDKSLSLAEKMIKRIKTYLQKRKALKEWKRVKMNKWLSEGRSMSDIKRQLKIHKVKF